MWHASCFIFINLCFRRLSLQISSLVLWSFVSATLFVIGTYIDQGVSLLLIFDIVFIFYKTLLDLKELRHLINDIKPDTVLTINKPLTETIRAVARGKVWRFPVCAFCITLIWMEHKAFCFKLDWFGKTFSFNFPSVFQISKRPLVKFSCLHFWLIGQLFLTLKSVCVYGV